MIADLPPPEQHAHGTRARYVAAKCRCDACRAANTQYARDRAKAARDAAYDEMPPGPRTTRTCTGANGQPCPTATKLRADSTGTVCAQCRPALVFNGLVDADLARSHLQRLSRQGVGLDAVHFACDVARSVLADIFAGRKKQIRASTSAKILTVDADARLGGSSIPAGPTKRLLADLFEAGFTEASLARRFGATSPKLQIGKRPRVLASTALKVARLHRVLELDRDDAIEVPDDTTYVRDLIVAAVRKGHTIAHEIHEYVIADYGSRTLRQVHRDLATMVEVGQIKRTKHGYAIADQPEIQAALKACNARARAA